jgi:hypothetical protein
MKKYMNVQFATPDHVTDHKNMPMATDSQEYSGNSKKGEHLLPSLWTCISPPLDAGVNTLRELVNFGNIEPGNIF